MKSLPVSLTLLAILTASLSCSGPNDPVDLEAADALFNDMEVVDETLISNRQSSIEQL
jgi:hypothetical protein